MGALAVAAVAAPTLARAACTLGRLAELPVTMVGLRPIVTATVNGREARFLADSGGFFSMITPAAASELKLSLSPMGSNFRLSGVGGDAEASVTTVKSFKLASADLHNVEFLVAGGELGGGASGAIGQNVLGVADVEFDLGHGAVRLMRPRGCEHAMLAYWAGARPVSTAPMQWIDTHSNKTLVTVEVDGHALRAELDSGAELSVLTKKAARDAGLNVDGPNVQPAGWTSGIGRRLVRTWIAPVKSFAIGDEEIRNAHLRIADTTLGDEADMLLGADFLLAHRVYVAAGQHRLYFTYEGGPVFNLETARAESATAAAETPVAAPRGASSDTPTDADGYARRAALRAARRDWAGAVEDYDRAAALAPTRADLPYGRALAHLALDQPAPARRDLDAALGLDPALAEARVLRAGLRLHEGDREGARADVDAAAGAVSAQADVRLLLSRLYGALALYPATVAQLDLWVAAHGDDSRLGEALGERCWARALSGAELDRALGDCRRAAHLRPESSLPRGAMGVIELRRGDDARAAADFTLALKGEPRRGWWLYGRGLAELHTGREAEGRADLAAAAAVAPRLAEQARGMGLAPPRPVAPPPSAPSGAPG